MLRQLSMLAALPGKTIHGTVAVLLAIAIGGQAPPSPGQVPPLPGHDHAATAAFNRALGVECSHCHTSGDWTNAAKPAFATAGRMMQMVKAVNARLEGVGRVGCVTCHGGETRPARQRPELLDPQLAAWPADLATASESLKVTMTVYNIALGVSCSHCHSAEWKAKDKPQMRTAALMNSLFELFPKYMPPGARAQCFMCHKGSTKPLGD